MIRINDITWQNIRPSLVYFLTREGWVHHFTAALILSLRKNPHDHFWFFELTWHIMQHRTNLHKPHDSLCQWTWISKRKLRDWRRPFQNCLHSILCIETFLHMDLVAAALGLNMFNALFEHFLQGNGTWFWNMLSFRDPKEYENIKDLKLEYQQQTYIYICIYIYYKYSIKPNTVKHVLVPICFDKNIKKGFSLSTTLFPLLVNFLVYFQLATCRLRCAEPSQSRTHRIELQRLLIDLLAMGGVGTKMLRTKHHYMASFMRAQRFPIWISLPPSNCGAFDDVCTYISCLWIVF